MSSSSERRRALRGHDQRPVLDERSRRRPDRRRSPAPCACPRRGAARRRPAGGDRRVRSCRSSTSARSARTRREVDLAGDVGVDQSSPTPAVGTIVSSGSPACDRRSHLDRHLVHHARDVRGDDVLHLHRLEHDERLPASHRVTGPHVDRDDRALDRRRDDVHRTLSIATGAIRVQLRTVPSMKPTTADGALEGAGDPRARCTRRRRS